MNVYSRQVLAIFAGNCYPNERNNSIHQQRKGLDEYPSNFHFYLFGGILDHAMARNVYHAWRVHGRS